ncbi:MAG TPA: hypothetical protein DFS52_10530 [Myxococcales bacterium]|nr:hypothetical protein [Myxococcales bacterium]
MAPLGELSAPPVFEVISGLVFQPLPELSPLVLGSYWERKRQAFPHHQLHPALADEPTVVLEALPPLRVWLVSADDEFVLQIQSDRFYLNWRARGQAYPRFGDHGTSRGIRSRFEEEYRQFAEFCEQALGRRPAPVRLELAKVDHLVEGKHWSGLADLALVVPWVATFAGFSQAADTSLALRFRERRETGALAVGMDLVRLAGDEDRRVLKLETRTGRPIPPGACLPTILGEANAELNEVFGRLISPEGISRFGQKEQAHR